MSFLKIFDNIDLVPQQWQEGGDTHYYTFNPTIIKIHEGYAMCYRLVSSTNLLRKLATCHLSNKFEIIPGTVTPLSDLIEFAVPEDFGAGETIFHADARYFFLKGKYYISFNNGKTSKPNHQFLIEMKSTGLIPDGKAREIIINDTRQAVEKNWMFFEIDGRVFSIYSITPHRILDVDLSNADYVFCEEAYSSKWENQYEEIFGELRSSVTPILMNDRYLTLFHSRYPMPVGVHYVCGFYEFECKPPFRVLRYSAYPFDLPASKSKYTMKALHKVVSECVYPCGLVKLEKELIVSYGILNEKVAIASLDIEKINDSLIPVVQPVQKAVDKKEEFHVNQNKHQQQKLMIPMFWWDAKGWKYGGKEAQRIFKTGNVGDTFAPEIVDKLAGIKVRQPLEDEIKLISLGSLIHRAGNDDIIWGTGIKGNMMHLKEGVDRLRVFAVRGPHTLDFLKQKNIDVSKVSEFFDPGCLVSFMFQDMIATLNVEKNHGFGKFRIIPHFRDDVYIRRKYYKYWNNLISADMSGAPKGRDQLCEDAGGI